MNVVFRVPTDDELQTKFLAEAAAQEGFVNLKGHRSVGGMRASIYNSMPMEGAVQLAAFMDQFRSSNLIAILIWLNSGISSASNQKI